MWTEHDDKMLSSIETELLTLIDTYEFTFENPHSTEADKKNSEAGISFKYKQIEWLNALKDRIMTPEEKEEREKKRARFIEVNKEINHLDNQIRDIYGLTGQTNVVTVNIQQLQQVKVLEEKKKELYAELNKLKYETL